jgi:Raf kinase inhibitor-like YbhB/YbcL family protein
MLLITAVALAGCGNGGGSGLGEPPAAPDKVDFESSAFDDGGRIPKQFTCDEGNNLPPPLDWSGVPGDAASLALILEDPDAPGGTFVHWTLFGIDPQIDSLAPGEIPEGAEEGKNSFGDSGYGGPCPPKGDSPHHYVFTLYALKRPLTVGKGAEPKQVLAEIENAAIARGRLTGTYGRH